MHFLNFLLYYNFYSKRCCGKSRSHNVQVGGGCPLPGCSKWLVPATCSGRPPLPSLSLPLITACRLLPPLITAHLGGRSWRRRRGIPSRQTVWTEFRDMLAKPSRERAGCWGEMKAHRFHSSAEQRLGRGSLKTAPAHMKTLSNAEQEGAQHSRPKLAMAGCGERKQHINIKASPWAGRPGSALSPEGSRAMQ